MPPVVLIDVIDSNIRDTRARSRDCTIKSIGVSVDTPTDFDFDLTIKA